MAAITVRQAGIPRTLTWLALLALAVAAVVAIVLTSDATGSERAWLLVALASTGAAGVGIARAMQLLLPRLSLRTQLALATVTGFVVLVADLLVECNEFSLAVAGSDATLHGLAKSKGDER